MALQWFHFDGGDPGISTNYTKYGSSAPTDCPGSPRQLCAIQADDNSGSPEPVLDVNIALEMADALQNQKNTTNVLLKAR